MAKDQVIGFLHDLVGDPKLNRQVSREQRDGQAWAELARQSGYEFSVDELKDVSEEISQRSLAEDEVVPSLLESLTAGADDVGSPEDGEHVRPIAFTPQGIARLKAVMQQGRYSGYYRPW
jgi:hypothetical protein